MILSRYVKRERTSLPLMLYGVYVYLCSNSLRRASRILEPLVERSHEAIRQWVQRLAPICDRFDVDRRLVRKHLRGRDDDSHQGEAGLGLGRLRARSEGIPWVAR